MRKRLQRYFRSFVDVKPGEWRIAALLFAYYLLVIFAYYILKPVSRALFLDKFDADKLPWLYIFMAFLGGTGATWMSKAAMRERITSVIGKSQVFLIANILLIWWLLKFQSGIVLYVFSIWVGTFSVITVGQFWLLAQNLLDSRIARRLLPIIGVAAVIGGVLGGTITSVLVHHMPARHLMLVCGLLVTLTFFVVRALRNHEHPTKLGFTAKHEYSSRDNWKLVRESAHLRSICLLVALMFIVDTLIDYQFSVVAKQTYQGPQLTAFLAHFQGIYLNLLSFTMQLFLTRPVLRLFGVGGTLGFAPAGVTIAGVALLAYPSLLAVSVMRAVEAASRYTFTRTGMEMLYLPVSREVKNRVKVFLEVAVDRLSRGTAGGLLLLFTVVLNLSLRSVTIFTLCVVGAWVVVVTWVLRSYVMTLRKSIERRDVSPDESIVQPWDRKGIQVLVQTLNSPNPKHVAYALELLKKAPQVSVSKHIPALLRHESPDVRLSALRLLRTQNHAQPAKEAAKAIGDPDARVRAEAVSLICAYDSKPDAKLASFLTNQDLEVRRAALDAAEQLSPASFGGALDERWFATLLSNPDPNARAVAAKALRFADGGMPTKKLLGDLLKDSDPDVVNAALASAAASPDEQFIPLIIEKLRAREFRRHAREALAAHGERIVPRMVEFLANPAEPDGIREQAARVLGKVGGTAAAEALLRGLADRSARVRFGVLRALNRMRRQNPELALDGQVIDQQLLNEARTYYELLVNIQAESNTETPGRRLLIRSLQDRLDRTLERIFRLLGLRFPPRDIFHAYRALRSPQSEKRAAALELLENTLAQPAKGIVLPLVEGKSWEELEPIGKELFGVTALTCEECLRELISGDDRWLKAVALYRASELQSAVLQSLIRTAQNDSDPLITETAAHIARRLAAAA